MVDKSSHSGLSNRDVLLNRADAFALELDQLAYLRKYEGAVDTYDPALSIYPSNPDLGGLNDIIRFGVPGQKCGSA